MRIDQEQVAALLENVVDSVKQNLKIDHRILDELNSTDSEQAVQFKSYLNSLEALAHHWQLVQG